MTRPKGPLDDPGFASAIEKAYLVEVAKLEPGSTKAELTTHSEILEQAIYKADRRGGGLRFKRLVGTEELEARLLRALTWRLRPNHQS